MWGASYVVLLTAVFLAYCAQQLILPTLPLYVQDLGGSTAVAGLVLAAFSVTSFPMRPIVGYLADSWSPRGVLTLGPLTLAVTGFGLFVHSFWGLGLVNAVRGVGWAALNTGGYTVLARIAPQERRGEASSFYNLATSLPVAVAPAVALWLVSVPGMGFGAVFLVSCACAGLGLVVALALRWLGTGVQSTTRSPRGLPLGELVSGFVDRRVFLASGLLLTITVTQVAASAFVPLYARHLDIEGVGLYFVVSGAVGIVSQLVCTRFLDRGGRGGWLVAGFGLLIASMLVLLAARNLEMLVVAGVLNATGSTIQNTMLLVVAMDLSDPDRPGAGMATYSVSYQLGAALGAPVFGLVIEMFGFGAMFLGAAASLIVGLVATVMQWGKLAHPLAAPSPASAGSARV